MRRQDIHKGMKVHASDGTSLGKVVALGEETFLIEKGFFFPKDFYVRYELVTDIRDSEIWLSESGELLKGRMSKGEYGKELAEGERVSSEEHRIPLSEEQLIAQKRQREAGEARAGEATFREQDVTIPVTEEEVEIRKRPVVKEEVRVSKGTREEVRTLGAETRSEEAKVETKGDVYTHEEKNK